MNKVMLVGEKGVGKRSLIQALSHEALLSRKPMAVEYHGQFVNTPGEFLENRRFYYALISTSATCKFLFMVQDATRNTSLFPPLFATMFNKTVVGVISKVDETTANISRAERFLQSAGAKNIVCVSTVTGEGVEHLRSIICV